MSRPAARNGAGLPDPRLLLGLQLAAFGPVWAWWARRLTDGSDAPWGLAALSAAALFALFRGRRERPAPAALALAGLLTLAYAAATGAGLPPLARAALALAAVGALVSAGWFRGRAPLAFWALLFLSLPLLASLQFYAGYPLRAVAARLAAGLLRLQGLDVAACGTLLESGGRTLAVDAPCSGARLLAAGGMLTAVLALRFRLDWRGTLAAGAAALALAVAGNALRAAALFHLAAAPAAARAPAGEGGVGLAVFLLVGAALGLLVRRLERRMACAAPRSPSSC